MEVFLLGWEHGPQVGMSEEALSGIKFWDTSEFNKNHKTSMENFQNFSIEINEFCELS